MKKAKNRKKDISTHSSVPERNLKQLFGWGLTQSQKSLSAYTGHTLA
jgi:hypothetical protein